MPINFGQTGLQKFAVGVNPVPRIFAGGNLVFSSSVPPPNSPAAAGPFEVMSSFFTFKYLDDGVTLTPLTECENRSVGYSVHINSVGNILVSGEPAGGGICSASTANKGAVRTYRWNGNNWLPSGPALFGDTSDSINVYFGIHVRLNADGNILAVGCPQGSFTGWVAIYTWSGTQWVQRGARIIGGQGSVTTDATGWTFDLSADGNVIVTGSPGYQEGDTTMGRVRVHVWSGSQWIQRGATIFGDIYFGTVGRNFGGHVSISGSGNTIAAVGYMGATTLVNGVFVSTTEPVKIYDWNGESWIKRAADIAGVGHASGYQSYSASSVFRSLDTQGLLASNLTKIKLSDDGTTIVVGYPLYIDPFNPTTQNNVGLVRVYDWANNTWTQRGSDITLSNSRFFGYALAISDDKQKIMISRAGSGNLRIYNWTGTQWSLVQAPPYIAPYNTEASVSGGINAAFTAAVAGGGATNPIFNGNITASRVVGATIPAATTTGINWSTTPQITALVRGDRQIYLAWTVPDGLNSQILDYVVQFSSNSGSIWSTFARNVSTATATTVTGLTNGVTFIFRVAAVTAADLQGYSSPSEPIFPVGPPGAPTNLTATAGSNAVSLSWAAPLETGGVALVRYVIEASTDAGATWGPKPDSAVFAPTTATTVDTLTAGVTYRFRVRATNDFYLSGPSNVAIATPT
jgi:hypothetical protein